MLSSKFRNTLVIIFFVLNVVNTFGMTFKLILDMY